MGSIDRLKALLEVDEDGEGIATTLAEMLVDPSKRFLLLARLNETQEQTNRLRQDERLTRPEEVVRTEVMKARRPLTAKEVSELAAKSLRSLQHRSHMSTTLNSLVAKGVIGRIYLGPKGELYFCDAKEAVLQALKARGESPYDCSPHEVSLVTGITLPRVVNLLLELTE